MMFRQGDKITIKQTADRLIVTRETTDGGVMSSYALDGSESRNTGPGGGSVSSKTKWEGMALVTDATLSMSTPRGDMSMKTREVRTLSDDRNTMALVSTMDTPGGKRITTVTFARSQQ